MKNVAIVGYGGQGAWHTEQVKKSDVCCLLGVYDIKENRRNVANENGINVYSSNDQLFKDPKVDIVVIATPNDTHKDLVIEALKNGKNVICEKPVEMSVEALDQMISASEKYNRFFTVHQNRRWDVDFFGNKKHC